jgi:hypothetical protein
MTDYTRQHYGLATTGKPTQEPSKKDEPAAKAPPPSPKEKR